MKPILQGLTPIQPFPVKGKGSNPFRDGEDQENYGVRTCIFKGAAH